MTSSPAKVECPACRTEVKKYLRECETATCPACGHVVDADVWTFRAGVPAPLPSIDLDYSPEARDWIKRRPRT